MVDAGVCEGKESLFKDISIGSKHNNYVRMMLDMKYYYQNLINKTWIYSMMKC